MTVNINSTKISNNKYIMSVSVDKISVKGFKSTCYDISDTLNLSTDIKKVNENINTVNYKITINGDKSNMKRFASWIGKK